VVGASDTGISLIESLMTIRDVNFTSLTLLAPGGLITMNVQESSEMLKSTSTNYTLNEIRNLMLESRITVIDAKMMRLDKKGKKITLDKNSILPYDVLITTVGLIDTQLQQMNIVSTGIIQEIPNFKDYQEKVTKLGVFSIDDPYLYKYFRVNQQRESAISLLCRKKKP